MDLGPSKFMPCILLKNKLLSLITTDFTTILKFQQRLNWDITLKFKFMEPEYINSLELFCDILWSHLRFLNSLWNSSPSGFLVSICNSISPSDIWTVHVGLSSVFYGPKQMLHNVLVAACHLLISHTWYSNSKGQLLIHYEVIMQ